MNDCGGYCSPTYHAEMHLLGGHDTLNAKDRLHIGKACVYCSGEREVPMPETEDKTVTISRQLYDAFTYAVLEFMNRKGVVVLAPTPQILTTSELRFYPNTGNFEFIYNTEKRYEVIAP